MDPIVSVIIPCYNHGRYLEEAIQSIEKNAGKTSYEIIIMDDGSTDLQTIDEFKRLKAKGYKVLHQTNQGLAAARNNAISTAKGKYIIPLDSDNKLHRNYLVNAVAILEDNPAIDVVYGDPVFFGIEEGIRSVGQFDLFRIIKGNFIDACAVYRKEVWGKVGGYDSKMPVMGHEDWEFWINIALHGGTFYYLDSECFYYRSLPDSMAKTISTPSQHLSFEYIYNKHGYNIIVRLLSEIERLKQNIDFTTDYLKNHKTKSIIKTILGYKI